jgi:hypothetical protein
MSNPVFMTISEDKTMKVRHYQQTIALNSNNKLFFTARGKNIPEMVTEGEPILPLLPRHRALGIP